jgi:hypothetical protein
MQRGCIVLLVAHTKDIHYIFRMCDIYKLCMQLMEVDRYLPTHQHVTVCRAVYMAPYMVTNK